MSSSMDEVNVVEMPPPKQSSSINSQSSKRKRVYKNNLNVWDHFTKKEVEGEFRAFCKYCPKDYKADSSTIGTSTMRSHLVQRCVGSGNPCRMIEDNQSTLSFKPKEGGGGELVSVTFNLEALKRSLAECVVIDELPFRFVEGEGFLKFMSLACPRFKVPSRVTIARTCLTIYIEEKKKLKRSLKGKRVSITTDTWTSLQNINYMCVTAHYIDEDWVLCKRILNFYVVPNHKGVTIGKMVVGCLREWGLDSLMTVTCDNASSNDVAIQTIKKKIKDWRNVVLELEFIHVRCSSHVLNLVVKKGLKLHDDSIARVRESVRYVRSSPSRWSRWKQCVKDEQIDSNRNVCLDVATRWNSTYLMLDTAVKFERAFERLKEDDKGGYKAFFERAKEKNKVAEVDEWEMDENEIVENEVDEDEARHEMIMTNAFKYDGTPSSLDWKRAKMFSQILEVYYKATNRISGSNYVTSDLLFNELLIIKSNLRVMRNSNDTHLSQMGVLMENQFEKYWNLEKLNPILIVPVVLDPRFKLKYVGFSLKHNGFYLDDKIEKNVKSTLDRLYEWYVEHNRSSSSFESSSQGARDMVMEDMLDPAMSWTMHNDQGESGSKSELEKYLEAPIEGYRKNQPFDLLKWWKLNSTTYPILSLVAKDVLAIPVSSVASESAFSTGGRLLDSFRTSLRPNTVQALICLQNWLRVKKPIDFNAAMDEIEQLDEIDEEILESSTSMATTEFWMD